MVVMELCEYAKSHTILYFYVYEIRYKILSFNRKENDNLMQDAT